MGIRTPERFKGIFQQDHKPCATCTKYIYDQLKKEKACQSLTKPRSENWRSAHGYKSDAAFESIGSQAVNLKGVETIQSEGATQQRTRTKPRNKPFRNKIAGFTIVDSKTR